MRVLHVSAYFAPAYVYGGPPRTIHGLCRALRDAGVDARVVTTTANGDSELEAAPEGTTFDGIPVRYCRRRAPRSVWNAERLRAAIRSEIASADLVHLHGLWHVPGWIAAAEARRSGVPYVISPRGMLLPAALSIHRLRKRMAAWALQNRTLRGASLIHATSVDELAALETERLGPRVALVPNGVDVPEAAEPVVLDTSLGVRKIVLYVGRIHPIKRLDLLAAATARLKTPDVAIVIAGPDEQNHRVDIEPLFEGANVVWTGAIDEHRRAAWLRRASLVVCCSDSESFGMTLAEAMAASVPVVATRTCPWPDIETELTGRWVAQDPASIAAAMDEILQDDALAARMGENGHALVSRRYAWPAVAAQMIGHYHTAIGARAVA